MQQNANSKKAVLLDGAMGTSLWEKTDNKVDVWRYNVENPGIVQELHREYLEAGAQIILANTFGANRTNVCRSEYTVEQIVSAALRLAREAIGDRAKIALSIGPLSGLLEPYGDISEEYAFAAYDEQIGCGVESGADLIFIQTFTDLAMAKIAATAARKHMPPLLCSFSFDQHGRTMMGNSVEQIIREMQPFSPDAIGLNCSLGPDAALPVIREFARLTDLPLIFKPNAGKSTVEDGCDLHEYSAEVFADDCLAALEAGATYIGGCCGSNAHYIRHLRTRLQELGYLE